MTNQIDADVEVHGAVACPFRFLITSGSISTTGHTTSKGQACCMSATTASVTVYTRLRDTSDP